MESFRGLFNIKRVRKSTSPISPRGHYVGNRNCQPLWGYPSCPSPPADEESLADFDAHDDSDVKLNAVIEDALGITVESEPERFVVACAEHAEESGDLEAATTAEDVWAYTDDGVHWDEVEELNVGEAD
ncbi:hypothetical protein C8J57DRAFT_1220389 [Mycena rebaudengoi]|nr:hypothetical protein C8J57DRAFT_1220389 [Mycena rebaudengoi]